MKNKIPEIIKMQGKKIFKYSVIAFAAAGVLAVSSMTAMKIFLETSGGVALLERYIENKYKFDIFLGDVDVALFSEGGIVLTGAHFGEGEKYIISSDKIIIELSPVNFFNNLGIVKFNAHKPEVYVNLDNFQKSKSSKKFSIPEIRFKGIDAVIENKGKQIVISGDIEGNVNISYDRFLMLAGEVKARNAVLKQGNSLLTIDGTVLMDGRKLLTEDLSVKSPAASVLISGILTMAERLSLEGKVLLNNVMIDGRKGGESNPVAPLLKYLDADVDVVAGNMILYGIPVGHAAARAVIRNGRLDIINILARGEKFFAVGYISTHGEGISDLDIQVIISSVKMQNVISSVSSGKPWIEGPMNVEGRIWGSQDSLNGDLMFSASRGRILKYSFLSKIFGLFNLYKIVTRGEMDLKKKGFTYNSILAHLKIKDSVVTFDDFFLDSSSIQVSARGSYRFDNSHVDVVAGIHPLETVDRIIKFIPVVGWILMGKDRGLLVMHMNVYGPVDNLKVLPMPARTVSKTIAGSILRTLTLPYTIFTRPHELFPGFRSEKKKSLRNFELE